MKVWCSLLIETVNITLHYLLLTHTHTHTHIHTHTHAHTHTHTHIHTHTCMHTHTHAHMHTHTHAHTHIHTQMPAGVEMDKNAWVPVVEIEDVGPEMVTRETQTEGLFYPSARTIAGMRKAELLQKTIQISTMDRIPKLHTYSPGKGKRTSTFFFATKAMAEAREQN